MYRLLLTILPGYALTDLTFDPNALLTPRDPPLQSDEFRHSFSQGTGQSTDVLLFSTTAEKWRIPFVKRTEVIHCPRQNYPGFVKLLNATISAIYVLDTHCDGGGGYVNVTDGGVGHNFAELSVTSQRGGPYCFFIRIYGRYNASHKPPPPARRQLLVNVPVHTKFHLHQEFPSDYDYKNA